jgi:hypothetical protein
MNNLAALLFSPLALILPAALPQDAGQRAGDPAGLNTGGLTREGIISGPVSAPPRGEPAPGLQFDAPEPPAQQQVRIEQRVIIRISPRSDSPRSHLAATIPPGGGTRLHERRVGKCLPVEGIAGVQPSANNRLVLFMRDRRVITLALDRSCNARDFYSGFYVERQEDGQLCSGRDMLQSRAGASCEVGRMTQLVLERD